MNNKKVWIFLAIILVIFIGTIVYNNYKVKQQIENDREQAIKNELERPSMTLNVKHQFKNGTHRFLGEVELPTPCHSLETKIEKSTDKTTIAITSTSTSEICAQTIVKKKIAVEFSGTENENIMANWNGELINLNIFEVGPNENFDDAEFFIKG